MILTQFKPKNESTVTPAAKKYRTGRQARSYNSRIPHMSALVSGTTPATPPSEVDWSKGMPANLGMMLNDTLGDCTCAAVYHAIQVWTFNASGSVLTEPDHDVERLYVLACGYNPRVPGEGPGGNEQTVLTFWQKNGVPMTNAAGTQYREKAAAFIEIDVRNTTDIKNAINDCGLVYIGLNVPQYIVPDNAEPPAVWDVENTNNAIVGGHAVILVGYNSTGLKLISWGQYYTMTWAFLAKYVDEVYAIANSEWIEKKGTTPGGLTLDELETQMEAL